MMNPCSDPEEQRTFKLNECLLVANKIQEAGHSKCQGFSKLRSCKRNPNGGDGGASTSPNLSSWNTTSAKYLFTLSMQGSDSIPIEISFPLSRSSRLEEKHWQNKLW
jgi:hypothetical protein